MTGLEAGKNSLIFLVLITAAWKDSREMRIPNWLTGAGWFFYIPFFMAEWRIGGKEALIQEGRQLAGSVLLILGFAIFAAVSRRSFGFGDVKLLGVIALYQGIEQTFGCLMYGMFLAAGISLVLLALGKITRKVKLPLAPFFLTGYLLMLFEKGW